MEPSQQLVAVAQSHESPLLKILMVACIAIGIQFVWALQISLLTPYIQLLGIPHKWAALVWICSPICGLVVSPMVGYYSDNCTSRFGRRRPYIVVGAVFVVIAVFLISFAADIGHATGDLLGKHAKPRAIIIFTIGFWILDVSNTMIQGPCRALLSDLSGINSSKTRTANFSFVFFLSVGCVLGFAASSFNKLHKMFPFTLTKACDVDCANLKSCFFLSIALLLILTSLTLTFVKEDKYPSNAQFEYTSNFETTAKEPFYLGGILTVLKDFPKSMWILFLLSFLNNFAWSPFLTFNTDWVGREVYGGKVGDENLYVQGVHAGSLGLMIQAAMVGVTAFVIEFCARGLRGGINTVWVVSNLFLTVCLLLTVPITKVAESSRKYTTTSDGNVITLPPAAGIKAATLTLVSATGISLGVNQCVPFALASIYARNSGIGLCFSLGLLSVANAISSLIVSFLLGPWDALFGGSNLPGFIVGAFAAAASGIVAWAFLPPTTPDTPLGNTPTTSVGTTHH